MGAGLKVGAAVVVPVLKPRIWLLATGLATAAAIVGAHFLLFPESGRRVPILLLALAAAVAPLADARRDRRRSEGNDDRETASGWQPWGRARSEDVVHPWQRWRRDDT